jgi:tetratricopeptide (TPR) repeat protein
MSPEAVRGEELDARSDIWSLGVVLYEALAGRRLFGGAQVTPVLASILEDPVPDLRQERPDAPPALAELLQRMLHKERGRRPSSMRQVAADLEAVGVGESSIGVAQEWGRYKEAGSASTPLLATPSHADDTVISPLPGALQTASGYPPAPPSVLSSDSPPGAAERYLFVAREQELGRLEALLDAAVAAQSQVTFVVGEAGQGKTALLQAFASRAQQAHPDLLVAGGNSNAYTGAGDPYLPFREILELLTGDVEADALAGRLRREHAERLWQGLPAAAQALLEVGPDLLDTFISARRLLGRAAGSGAGGAAWLSELQALAESKADAQVNPQQQDLFEQYAKVIQALARRAPLLLLLDDLQWADPGSANLLLHLGRRLQGHRVLIVGAYRPTDVALGREGQRHPLERVLNELQRDFGEIVLDLSRAKGRAFVDAVLDAEPNRIGETFRAALYQQTGGHPLFTIELLRDMQERGAMAQDRDGRWVVAPSLDWSCLPARVEGAIGERVGRLDSRLRELLQIASVEGEEFTAEIVARALGADEHEVVRQLSRELDQTHHLVRALGVRRDEGVRQSRYRFQHILIQRYLYGSLDEVERVYRHEAVGHALEARYGGRVAEIAAQLARHFEVAQLPEKAAFYHEQAGDQARRAAALAEAADCYQAALEASLQSDPAGQAQVLRKLGECRWMRGHLRDALVPFEACYALYASLGNKEGAGAVQRLLGRLYWEMGDHERSRRHYYQALELLEQGPESLELAWAINSIAQMHMVHSENDQAISWGQRALDMAERLGAEQVIIQALINLGSSYFASGDAERGQSMLRRSWQRAVELNLPHDACRAGYNLGVCLTDLGLPADARVAVEELHAYAVRMQIPLFAGLSSVLLVRLDWATGHWQRALSRREEVLAWIDRGQSIGFLEVNANTTFVRMHNDLGQPEVARRILEQARPKVESRAETQTTGPHLGQEVRALGMLGFEDEATEVARRFLVLIEPEHGYLDNPMSVLMVCRWFAGRAADMRAELSACLTELELAHAQYNTIATAASLGEGRGVVALREGEALRAVEYFQQAADQWQALGRPYDQARTLTDLGLALLQSGSAAEAHAALDGALGLVEALAAQLEDADMKAAFLASPVVQELQYARASLLVTL